MPTLIMSWSGVNPLGDSTAVIEITNNAAGIMVPPEACGFRLERPGQLWPEYWGFLTGDGVGAEVEIETPGGGNDLVLSSSNPNIPTTELIEARGPVGGCAGGGGNYVFVTPLGALGIGLTFPTDFGAGSFIADFATEDDITWLDFDGTAIVVDPPGASVPTATLPPEFFEQPPSVKGCFRDFEGKLHCPVDADSAGQAAMDMSGTGFAMIMARNATVLPGFGVVPSIAATPATVASGAPLEVTCPVELRMEVRFVKAADVPPGNVRYRFRFAHGPMSTTFSRNVIDNGVTSVVHSVPLPLPEPRDPPRGGAVGPGAGDFAIFRPPVDPLPPGNPTPQGPDGLTIEPLPDNRHKGSVRVEVLNSSAGIIVSGWATYDVICAPGSNMGTVTPGLVGPEVVSLQVSLNQWLDEQDLPRLNADGRFAAETERVVRQFQRQARLDEDAVVGRRTWRALMGRQSSGRANRS
ncbi:peptidoglycan-binding domain-containing protein [Yoonia sp. 2307UL14-13]|uniref:peptidoglycan-binding domain-containing protein n=1 Tax=Yoonia sp. 2307UL14-13 TaxID=3126506 RepID=UPI00309F0903